MPCDSVNLIQVGKTPLICASLKGHLAIVKLLLEKGANVNICDEVIMYLVHSAVVAHITCKLRAM